MSSSKQHLEVIDFEGEDISDSFNDILSAFNHEVYRSLQILQIAFHFISDEQAATLAEQLAITDISEIYIDFRDISDPAARGILAAIMQNNDIEVVEASLGHEVFDNKQQITAFLARTALVPALVLPAAEPVLVAAQPMVVDEGDAPQSPRDGLDELIDQFSALIAPAIPDLREFSDSVSDVAQRGSETLTHMASRGREAFGQLRAMIPTLPSISEMPNCLVPLDMGEPPVEPATQRRQGFFD